MKKIFAILLLVMASHTSARDAGTAITMGPLNNPEGRKVFKLVTRAPGSKVMWSATAFFISPTRLLTAAHTFKSSKDQWIVKDGREVHCKMIKIDFKKDIALIECEETNDSFYRLVSEVSVVGFPFGGELKSAPGLVDKEVHAKCYFVEGMSGGPVVNEYGDVEGMGVRNDWTGGDVCHAIQASALAEFVKSAE